MDQDKKEDSADDREVKVCIIGWLNVKTNLAMICKSKKQHKVEEKKEIRKRIKISHAVRGVKQKVKVGKYVFICDENWILNEAKNSIPRTWNIEEEMYVNVQMVEKGNYNYFYGW